MGRSPCCDKANVQRGPWSPDEDATLKRYLETHGTGGNWIALPQKAGLKRCGKSCRLRWLNYLRPNIKHGGFTEEEDIIIFTLYNQLGSRWSRIASQLPGRTDNDVKNYWNTKLKKKLLAVGKNTTSLVYKISNLNNDASTNINNTTTTTKPIAPCQAPNSLPCVPKCETNAITFSDSATNVPALPDICCYGPIINNTAQSLMSNLVPIHDHFSFPGSEFGVISPFDGHNNTVSPMSQEGSSSISDSSNSLAMDSKRGLPYHLDQTVAGAFLDPSSGFGFSYYDLVDGLLFQDKVNDGGSNCCPNLADFGHSSSDILSHNED